MEAHGTSREFGGFLSSMLTLFAMIATPLFGQWVDRIGKRALLMMFGSLLLIPVYLIMAYTQVSLYIPMAMMGVAFSLIPAAMWPSVAYILDQSKLGTAYGLMTMIQNIGLFGLNLLIGWANNYGHADAGNPAGYNLGVDVLRPGVAWRAVFVFVAAAGIGASWAWAGDDYYRQGCGIGVVNYQFPEVATLRSGWGLKSGLESVHPNLRMQRLFAAEIKWDGNIRRSVEIL